MPNTLLNKLLDEHEWETDLQERTRDFLEAYMCYLLTYEPNATATMSRVKMAISVICDIEKED